MYMNIFKLNLRLTMQKQRLVDMAMKYGLQDPRVIAQSHKVDRIVVEMQKMQKRRIETEGGRCRQNRNFHVDRGGSNAIW